MYRGCLLCPFYPLLCRLIEGVHLIGVPLNRGFTVFAMIVKKWSPESFGQETKRPIELSNGPVREALKVPDETKRGT